MKIAVLQLAIIWEDWNANAKKVAIFAEKAALVGAELLLLPEMSMFGFSMNVVKIAKWEEEICLYFQDLSVEYQLIIGFGYVKQNEEGLGENHYALAVKGEIIADYQKIHPFTYGKESQHYSGGTELAFAKIAGHMLGLSICYDLRFPELYQALSIDAELLIVAANWPAERRAQWLILLQARAIENQSFVVGINRVGVGDNCTYLGDSLVIDPQGKIIAQAGSAEELLFAEIDWELLAKYRQEFPVKGDRKKELYRKWLK
ncbi:MAG: nitrilase-related carbon-nitrogen hydrolase [Clostridia bacterium]